MKCIAAVLLGAILLQICVVTALDDSCNNDKDCKKKECCAKSRLGIAKSCKDKGDEVGERCGGDYLCSCEANFVCKPDPHTFWNKFRFGTGTCQHTNPPQWNIRYG